MVAGDLLRRLVTELVSEPKDQRMGSYVELSGDSKAGLFLQAGANKKTSEQVLGIWASRQARDNYEEAIVYLFANNSGIKVSFPGTDGNGRLNLNQPALKEIFPILARAVELAEIG